jgi:hypothetical protein
MGTYSEMSALMGAYPDVAIFRTFATLNTQNIAYLQAELMLLEHELGQIAQENRESASAERKAQESSWRALHNGSDQLQWEKFLEIRAKLADYSKAAP